MSKVGIFYGSDSGTTSSVAHDIAIELNGRGWETEVKDIAEVSVEEFDKYDNIILGTPTMGMGVLQDDWERKFGDLCRLNMSGKRVALFGTGDQKTYPDTFADGIGVLFDIVSENNGKIVGKWSTDGYVFRESNAVVDKEFVGLVIDMDTQPYHSSARIKDWVDRILPEFHN